MRGVFVTGTGTEVGKTVVAAAIARTARGGGRARRGLQARGHRPRRRAGEADHALLRRAVRLARRATTQIAPYRYGPPVSPHLGGRAGRRADRPGPAARGAARAAAAGADLLVCEGVGGLLVPLTPATWSATSPATSALPVRDRRHRPASGRSTTPC